MSTVKQRPGLMAAILLLSMLCFVLGATTGLHADGMTGDPSVGQPAPVPEPAPTTIGSSELVDLLLLVLVVT